MIFDDKCGSCRFWWLSQLSRTEVCRFTDGECRRHAPIYMSEGKAYGSEHQFPIVRAEEWCGDYEKKL